MKYSEIKIEMKFLCFLSGFLLLFSCQSEKGEQRIIEDFNAEWKFHLGDIAEAKSIDFNDANWKVLDVPHDWSVEEGYQKEGETASSTGFVIGGIGWYRKSFGLTQQDQGKQMDIAHFLIHLQII